MNHLAVIGYPIAHSKSPVLHNALYQQSDIVADFTAIEVAPKDLPAWWSANQANFLGLAITVPHKVTIMPLLNQLSEAAKEIGAVNTIYRQKQHCVGTNTDVIGIIQALQTVLPSAKNLPTLVLGAGGAARAVVYALTKAGALVTIWNRTAIHAQKLAQQFQVTHLSTPIIRSSLGTQFSLIINATSVGLNEWSSLLPEDFWSGDHIAMDMVYQPLETKFLFDCMQSGGQIITGDKVLIYQAAAQHQIWHQQDADIQTMEEAFLSDS